MIRLPIKAVVRALLICAAPLASAADRPAGTQPAAAGDATRAEMRHFAIFKHYRAMTDSSGGSAAGSTASVAGTDAGRGDGRGADALPGSALPGDQYVCPADSPDR
jgi:hypothetical protein